jgi:hypothetical protein
VRRQMQDELVRIKRSTGTRSGSGNLHIGVSGLLA